MMSKGSRQRNLSLDEKQTPSQLVGPSQTAEGTLLKRLELTINNGEECHAAVVRG